MSDILYDAVERWKQFRGNELDFIRIEISLALSFLDRADTTDDPEVRNRNLENARKAHDEIASRIDRHVFETTVEREETEAALVVLTHRLKAATQSDRPIA